MGKNRSAAGLTNIIKQDADGSIKLMHGSTMLMQVSSSGAITTTGVISGSNAASAISSSYAVSSSYSANADIASASLSTRVTNIEANYATTGSNTLTGAQNITSTTQPTNFDDTAALYTAGGLRVKGNVYLSSSLYLKGDLTVYGTQSINYITSSQLDISDNIINVNTAVPGVRFGGIAVYDSGSTGLTGSFLWDSQNNKWIYSNPSGSNYDGGMAIFGPRNTSGLGNEQGTTSNALMKGQGGDHVTSSLITEDGALMSMYSTMYVSSSGNVGIGTNTPYYALSIKSSISGANRVQLLPTTDYAFYQIDHSGGTTYIGTDNSTGGVFGNGNYAMTIYNSYAGAINMYTNATLRITITSGGSVGIGTTSPISGTALNIQGSQGAVILNNPTANSYTGYRIYNDQLSGYRALEIDYAGSTYGSALLSGGIVGESAAIGTTGAYPLQFGTSNTFRMVITSGGNVGIGTTNPGYPLQVSSGTGYAARFDKTAPSGDGGVAYFVNGSSSGYSSFIYIGSNPGTDWKVGKNILNPATNTYPFEIVDSSNNLGVRIAAGAATVYIPGKVGIGTSAPNTKLDVNGDFMQSGVTRVCIAGTINGNAAASWTINTTSQSSLKITAVMNHYGYIPSYGCARMSLVANGPTFTEVNITDTATGNGGSWSFTQIDSTRISINKNAGSYGGGGLYFIEIVGNNPWYN